MQWLGLGTHQVRESSGSTRRRLTTLSVPDVGANLAGMQRTQGAMRCPMLAMSTLPWLAMRMLLLGPRPIAWLELLQNNPGRLYDLIVYHSHP